MDTVVHKFDRTEDRCACGGQVLYFEDVALPGEGCEVVGKPWCWPSGEEIANAYEWLSDVIEDLPAFPSDAEIIRNVNRLYEGGWRAFITDNA